MKWTFDWLKDYLDTNETPDSIATKLNAIGLEIEDLTIPTLPVAAKIVECEKHSDSDHLHVLKVDDGSGELRQVVCGAPNVRVGLVSALAKPGCKIGDFEIGSGKIRGVVSNGMMCSAKELGLGNDHDGIMELNEADEVLGQTIFAMRDMTSPVFEGSITPNRPDYLSVSGIARDLSAAGMGTYLEQKINTPFQNNDNRKVEIENLDLCPIYRLAEIKNIDLKSSNQKIAARLSAIGVNPKNAAVDATNYICFDMGQPMHCFDADKVIGKITVRLAKTDEEFTDLFGTEHKLKDTDLVIADEIGVLAAAGVVGGMRSMTDDNTKNILLESAYFNPVSVRKTSKRMGLSSDASYRFERGIDPTVNGGALSRCASIIMEECGGEMIGVSIAGAPIMPNVKINYNPGLFVKKIGFDIAKDEQLAILKSYGYVVDSSADDWVVMPPASRVEIEIPEHIISDLIRMYGYDKIKIDNDKKYLSVNNSNDMGLSVKRHLVARGLNEHIYFGFGNDEFEKELFDKPNVMILNPITVKLNTLRNNLLCNMLDVISLNENRGYADIDLFSYGTVFDGDTPGAQHNQLVVVRTGVTSPKHWQGRNRDKDIYDVKSDILSLFGGQNLTVKTDNPPRWAHPYRYGALYQGNKMVGQFGELHPVIAKAKKIKTNVVIGLIEDTSVLPAVIKHKKIPVTEFQPVTRDFAFIVDADCAAEKITSSAKSVDARIDNITVFDSFEMGDNKKSVAFTITVIPTTKIGEDTMMEIQNKIIANVEKTTGGKIRDK